MNRLRELNREGQSFWYDNIRRRYLTDGTVKNMIDEDGLRGMTSNPSIFEKAIGSSQDYDDQIAQLAGRGLDIQALYESLAIKDIRMACDLFSKVHSQSRGRDGFVSLEVSPLLAFDTERTIAEALRLFGRVDRPNLMIKVPATVQGVPAVRQLISKGVNINITLMFSMDHYESVARAYLEGLSERLEGGLDITGVNSVASFFVSRVDSAVDKLLLGIDSSVARNLMGKAAIANAKIVYSRFQEIFHGASFDRLRSAGAPVQRLLWASTSTKNPDYPDTLYVDELIGPETVNTMPPATIEAFRDHGQASRTLDDDLETAKANISQLGEIGIDLRAVTEQLQAEGVEAFSRSFQSLLKTLQQKTSALAVEQTD